MRQDIKNVASSASTGRSIRCRRASIFANAGIFSAMIFVRNAHGSHNPREAMELTDFIKGADLLYHALLEAP
jgi:acetylornithine deacetylase/succinyl-diaminopimelate desuccinylase-like protein